MTTEPTTLPRRGHILAVVMVVVVSLMAACGPEEISRKQATDIVDSVAPNIGHNLGDIDHGASSFKSTLTQKAEADRDKIQRSEPPYDAIIGDAYSEVDYQFRLTAMPGDDAGADSTSDAKDGSPPVLTGRGTAILQTLKRLEAHALKTDSFERPDIKQTLGDAGELYSMIADIRATELSDEERKAAIDWLTGRQADTYLPSDGTGADSADYSAFLEDWLESGGSQRLIEQRERLQTVADDWVDVRIKLERLLARNAARYARKMKHDKLREPYIHPRHDDYWSDAITDGRRPDKQKGPYRAGQVWRQAIQIARSSANKAEILTARIRSTVVEVLQSDGQHQVTDVLDALQPAHPQYEGLVSAYERYRQYAENGGWQKVPVTPGLKPGVQHEHVKALKKRLRTEGFFPADATIDTTYGDALESAVETYQQTHQMEVTGEPHSMFWKSLNTPARRRARQIALNLQRWRDSKVDHAQDLYVLVNIPDFNVEVWQNQTRKMRFPIVVGNHDTKRVKPTNDRGEVIENAAKETVHPNHTPTFSAYIDRVIYNPYWNVTDRIREEEVLPKVRESVVAKYKEQLKSLKKKARQRRQQQQTQPRDARPQRSDASDAPSNKQASGESSPTLTATNRAASNSSASNAPPETDDGSSPESNSSSDNSQSRESSSVENRQSADQLPGLDSDSSESNAGAGETASPEESAGDSDGSNADEGRADNQQEAQQKVDISDLYERKEVTVDKKREIDEMRTVFDVEAIRTLLSTVHAPKQPAQSAEGNAGDKASGDTPANEKSTESSSSDDTDQQTLLAQHFPYLKPDKGWVDVSSTDPDHVPSWYAEHYYEVVFPGRKWEYVRVIPGAHNALGRVKVIFPNKHSVYLHDTPKKHLFSRNLRAFSHGCMRMEKPLSFAEFLLRQDDLYEKQNVDSLLQGERVPWSKFKKENNFKTDDPSEVIPANRLVKTSRGVQVIDYEYRPIFLKQMVPVHVQYMTVRVDQTGRPHFLADIYDKDEAALSEDG
jgi:murein L,D-transpeptidase YcbB/YkuD